MGTDVSSLTPTIAVSEFGSVSPASAVSRDFSINVTYTVTAEFGNTQDWTVTVTVAEYNAPNVANVLTDQTLDEGFDALEIDLSNTFSDVDGHTLTLSASSSAETIVTTAISGTTFTLTEVANGSAAITVTVIDGNGRA